MIRVDTTNGLYNSPIELIEPSWVFGFRFVHHIVSSDKSFIPIAFRDCLPQSHNPILEILLSPKGRRSTRVVAMPAAALPTLSGMKIKDDVELQFTRPVDDLIKECKSFWFIFHGTVVGFKMTIIEGDSNDIAPQAFEILEIFLHEEIVQKTIKEEACFALPHDL